MVGWNIARRVGCLFDTVVHPRTGQPYTNAEMARISAGGLTAEEVEGVRSGTFSDPTVKQVAALVIRHLFGLFVTGIIYLR